MELLSIRHLFKLINDFELYERTWKFDLRINYMLSAIFIGNDRGDQLSVADCLSWIWH